MKTEYKIDYETTRSIDCARRTFVRHQTISYSPDLEDLEKTLFEDFNMSKRQIAKVKKELSRNGESIIRWETEENNIKFAETFKITKVEI